MKQSYKFAALAAASALGAAALAGCDTSRTRIGDIDAHPERFAGKIVRIAGDVTHVYALPLSNVAAYQISDRTGQIWVISHSGAPSEGARVGLKGTAEPIDREDIPFLRDMLGDVVEEQQRKQF